MMKHGKSCKDCAVSPVVGVMLMLVVTIIIAAVVSAYAGGIASSPKKAMPNLGIEATYSQTTGMTISHMRGDPVALSQIDFRTTPSELFGADSSKFTWVINKTIIRSGSTTGDTIFYNKTGFYNISSFVVGDILYIAPSDCKDYTASTTDQPSWTKDPNNPPSVNANARYLWATDYKWQYFAAYEFQNPVNIGKYFYLDLVDPSGNLIYRTKVTITG
jgi:archaeal type IV pilus assembly protein PilA